MDPLPPADLGVRGGRRDHRAAPHGVARPRRTVAADQAGGDRRAQPDGGARPALRRRRDRRGGVLAADVGAGGALRPRPARPRRQERGAVSGLTAGRAGRGPVTG
ncbi:Exonuclease SbcC [Actinacidiphila cocklensis]|uniref:Exonuclease SbcC n=1 Tax=Actinacidiphila cocklensis TaxID=887465 RepID=A0A9W4DMW5_9ACTN|nr:Exonuclease SbcC [Actinacidiphila cocklensis]